MPLTRCKFNGKPGWKWGKSGKCYPGPQGRVKAERQAQAIRASGYTENQQGEKRRPNPLKSDPSRTTLLRKKFQQDISKRFAAVKGLILRLLVDEDALGLTRATRSPLVGNQRWRFRTRPEQVEAFRFWLEAQIQGRILPRPGSALEDAYWHAYVEQGYRKGAGRAFDDVRKAQLAQGSERGMAFFAGSRDQFLRQSFAHAESVQKVKLLAGRVYSDLKGITDDMSSQMSRTLTDGLVQGKNPRVIARDLNKVVDISRKRANVIARTEIIRAHAEGQLDAMEELGVTEVGVAVEWSTAGDDRVCPLCAALDGVVLSIKEAHGILPRHPSCRCSHIPANVGEDHRGQKRSKSRIEASIRKSLKAEAPKGRSVKQQKRVSPWAGADKSIARKRPKEQV